MNYNPEQNLFEFFKPAGLRAAEHGVAIADRETDMARRNLNIRIMMYSHDTFGLGHLRRCRTIAHSLVEDFSGLEVLIVSGATIAGAYEYRARVDFVKIPSVIKLRNGEYSSMEKHIDIHHTLQMRQAIIRQSAEIFQPDVFIVDKEPMGLRGEVEETLRYLKERNTHLVLGLRDVMDAPHLLDAEWSRKETMEKIDHFFDEIWVYGPNDFYDPLTGLDVPSSVRDRMEFVGFLQRKTAQPTENVTHFCDEDCILVTTGGGGDGADLVRDVLKAYHHDPSLKTRALIVLGPYLPAEERHELTELGASLDHIDIIEFDNRMENLVASANYVVAMGGYNTFCEIMSFDKPALIVPRTEPRQEQLIRTKRAEALNWVAMLLPEQSRDPAIMASALKALIHQSAPSIHSDAITLDGLVNISDKIERLFVLEGEGT